VEREPTVAAVLVLNDEAATAAAAPDTAAPGGVGRLLADVGDGRAENGTTEADTGDGRWDM